LARRAARPIVIAACLVALAASPARAGDAPPEEDHPVAIAVIGLALFLLPSDIGVFVPTAGLDFALGWSYQIAFTPNRRHRFMVGLDLIPTSDSEVYRMRGGYRYAYGRLIAGLTAAYTTDKDKHSDPTWSPELGVRLGRERFAFAHMLARAEIPMAFDGFRGVALLLGWDMI